MRDSDDEIHPSSGNVFADLQVSRPDEMLLKSDIVVELRRLIGVRGLTQSATADLTGVEDGELARLLGGDLRGHSVERLLSMLTAFDQEVQIISRPRSEIGEARISFRPRGAIAQPSET